MNGKEAEALIDGLSSAFAKLGAIADLRQDFERARQLDSKTCGHCYFWMKSMHCPKERNVNGISRGPSMNAYGCSKFQLDETAAKLKRERMAELEARADKLGLPPASERVRG